MTSNDKANALQSQVQQAIAANTPLQIRGGNTKTFLGRPVMADLVLDTTSHQGIVLYEPSELAITVRSGTPLQQVIDALSAENQQLPFEPPTFGPTSTIGGVIAAGLAGPRRPYNGAVRDSLLGVKLINGKGEILQFGGQVMKNVAGYDLSRPMAGAMGTLGVLLEVSLKLKPVPESEITLVKPVAANTALDSLQSFHQQPGNLSGLAWVDGRLYVRLAGCHEATAAAAEKLGGERLADGEAFWQDINNQQHAFFQDETPLWRLSIKPFTKALPLEGEQLLEWAGGLRWIKTTAPAEQIREIAAHAGGHATLFRPNSAVDSPFHPLPAELMLLNRQLKQAMDPQGIFNPGRLYAGL
jgi:glycolate oxidase FAD binding subunit